MERKFELDEALALLHFAFRSVVAKPDQMLAARGLSRVHHRILYFVRRNPDISVNRLLEMLGVSKQALNGPLRMLLKKKLVAVETASADRRVRQLRLTASGAHLELLLSGDQRRRFAAAFRQVGPRKEAAWRETMGCLAAGDPA